MAPGNFSGTEGLLIGWSVVPAREKFARLQPERLPIKALSNSPFPGDHGGTGGGGGG
jgi:hypothetical protein